MIVRIDERSNVPLYQQLRTALIAGILSGELAHGERLRSVRELASDLGINLHTVRKVYGMLADEGYIEVTRNKGAIVAKPPMLDEAGLDQFASVLRPLVIELRARRIGKDDYDELMDRLWHESIG
jgi:DNA-binding transcriptional regulator YhcF (GntR family)